MSDMSINDTGNGFQTLHFNFADSPYYVESGTCPNCGRKMYRAKAAIEKFGDGTPASCPYCQYQEDMKHSPSDREKLLTAQALKNSSYGFLYKNSIFGDEEVIKHTFRNFDPSGNERLQAGKNARKIEQALTDDHFIHGCFIGNSGTGKTHLTMGIVYQYMKHTNYHAKCLFINWNEYVSMNHQARNSDDSVLKSRIQNANFFSRKADLLVLDDIGMENQSAYTQSLLSKFAEYRASKSLIITTNKTISELSETYSSNVISRLFSHSSGYTFEMGNIPDYRITH